MNSESRGEVIPRRAPSEPLSPWYSEELGQDEPPHLRDYWRTLVKHRYSALAMFLACVVGTAAYTFTRESQYTATATVQIERQAPNVAPVQEVQRDEVTGYDKYDYYQTQYQILLSRTIAARVIHGLALDDDVRFTTTRAGVLGKALALVWRVYFAARSYLPEVIQAYLPGPPGDGPGVTEELGVPSRLVNRYLDSLSITPVRNSRLVKVGFESAYPALSAEIVNRHVEEYIGSAMQSRVDTTGKAKDFLEGEIAKARDNVVAAEAALNDFRKKTQIVSLDPGSPADIVSERLAALNKTYTEAQADRIRLEGQCELISRRNYEFLPDVANNKLIADLKQQLAKTESEAAELRGKFKPGYPKMRETTAREQQLRTRIDGEIAKIVGATQSACLAAQNREEALKQRLDEQRDIALSQKDVVADYTTLARDVDTTRTLYTSLVQRAGDIDVSGEIRLSNISIVDRAAAPQRASRPKKGLNMLVAGAAGLLLGVGVAFFLEYLDNTVKTPDDVEVRLGLPMLGVVPHFEMEAPSSNGKARAKRLPPPSEPQSDVRAVVLVPADSSSAREFEVLMEPRSAASEAYRVVRTAVLLSSADNPPQVILFTSGAAGEGKTVTAINQALTLAQAGGRVLLVDADIRRPRLHQVFNLPNGHGLSTFLAGQSDVQSVIHEVALSAGDGNGGNGSRGTGHLFVIPAGPTSPNPAELLGGRRMAQTIEVLRQQFDYILFDTPPVLPVADATVLSRVSDGVVVVVYGQHTPIDLVAQCRDRLRRVRARVLGVVLNNVDLSSPDYVNYGKYYSSYYSHESQDGTSA